MLDSLHTPPTHYRIQKLASQHKIGAEYNHNAMMEIEYDPWREQKCHGQQQPKQEKRLSGET